MVWKVTPLLYFVCLSLVTCLFCLCLIGGAQAETRLGGNWRNFWRGLEATHVAAAGAARAEALEAERLADVAAAASTQSAADAEAQRQGALEAERLLAGNEDQRQAALAAVRQLAEVVARPQAALTAERQLAGELPRSPAVQDLANSLSPRWALPVDPACPPSPEVQVDGYEQERLDLQAILKATMAQGPQEQGRCAGSGLQY